MISRWEEIKNRSIQGIWQSLKKKEFDSNCKVAVLYATIKGENIENIAKAIIDYSNNVNEMFETKEVVQVLDCSTNERIGVQIIYKEKK